MNVRVHDIMVEGVLTVGPGETVGQVRQRMRHNKVGSLPVAGADGRPLGIVTATDLLQDVADDLPVEQLMSPKVVTIPRYADVSEAARAMRKHRIHHLVVTHEKGIVGILSSFDLLRLVEERRFVPRDAPKPGNVRRLSGGRPETTIGGES